MARAYTLIKNLDTGAILPWHEGFASYKGLNWEPVYGDNPATAAPAPDVSKAAAPVSALDATTASLISELQAQLKLLREQNAALTAKPEQEDATEEAVRIASIKEAIAKVDVSSYAQAQGGFPSQPKVNDIKVLTGFNDVSREEIQAAML